MSSPHWARNHHTLATLALIGVTAVWGATFFVVRDAVEQMPVMPFLFWRFVLAAMILGLLRPGAVLGLDRTARRRGAFLGLVLGTGYITQTFGLLHTSATVSGFITGMFVVFTPLIAWVVLRQAVPPLLWFGAGLALAGLALISLNGLSMGFGELLTLVCALMFASHIVGLGQWSRDGDVYGLTVLQLAVVAGMCLIAAPLDGGVRMPPNAEVWAAIVFLAVAATALAYLAQVWAQAYMSAPRAAIVLTLEPVFAGIFGVTLGGDQLTARILAGGACVVAAMYIVELAPRGHSPALIP